jgi:hypothetical protein
MLKVSLFFLKEAFQLSGKKGFSRKVKAESVDSQRLAIIP